jgi:hypothetical protein
MEQDGEAIQSTAKGKRYTVLKILMLSCLYGKNKAKL